jgi:CBS domain-containing protein
MTSPVITIAPKASIEEALELMLRHHVSGLPVVDGASQLRGLITEYDVLQLYNRSDEDYSPYESCDRYMTRELVTVQDTASLKEATELLLEKNVRRLLVLANDRLVGVLARRDVARCIRDERLIRGRQPWAAENV